MFWATNPPTSLGSCFGLSTYQLAWGVVLGNQPTNFPGVLFWATNPPTSLGCCFGQPTHQLPWGVVLGNQPTNFPGVLFWATNPPTSLGCCFGQPTHQLPWDVVLGYQPTNFPGVLFWAINLPTCLGSCFGLPTHQLPWDLAMMPIHMPHATPLLKATHLLVGVHVDVTLDALLAHVGPAVAAHPLPLALGTLVLPKTPLLALVRRQALALRSRLKTQRWLYWMDNRCGGSFTILDGQPMWRQFHNIGWTTDVEAV